MSFIDTFKSSMVEVLAVSKQNPALADELLERLSDWLDEEMESRVNYREVHLAISDINNHLSVVSSLNRLEAEKFYNLINNDELRVGLAKYKSVYFQSIASGNYPLACKCVFQQIETLVNYLFFNAGLINILNKDNSKALKYDYKNENGRYSITLRKKIEAISDFYESQLRFISHFPLNKGYTFDYYNLCYRIRNYDSHGLLFDNNEAIAEEINDFGRNYTNYLLAPQKQLLKLRDLVLSIQIT